MAKRWIAINALLIACALLLGWQLRASILRFAADHDPARIRPAAERRPADQGKAVVAPQPEGDAESADFSVIPERTIFSDTRSLAEPQQAVPQQAPQLQPKPILVGVTIAGTSAGRSSSILGRRPGRGDGPNRSGSGTSTADSGSRRSRRPTSCSKTTHARRSSPARGLQGGPGWEDAHPVHPRRLLRGGATAGGTPITVQRRGGTQGGQPFPPPPAAPQARTQTIALPGPSRDGRRPPRRRSRAPQRSRRNPGSAAWSGGAHHSDPVRRHRPAGPELTCGRPGTDAVPILHTDALMERKA